MRRCLDLVCKVLDNLTICRIANQSCQLNLVEVLGEGASILDHTEHFYRLFQAVRKVKVKRNVFTLLLVDVLLELDDVYDELEGELLTVG